MARAHAQAQARGPHRSAEGHRVERREDAQEHVRREVAQQRHPVGVGGGELVAEVAVAAPLVAPVEDGGLLELDLDLGKQPKGAVARPRGAPGRGRSDAQGERRRSARQARCLTDCLRACGKAAWAAAATPLTAATCAFVSQLRGSPAAFCVSGGAEAAAGPVNPKLTSLDSMRREKRRDALGQ